MSEPTYLSRYDRPTVIEVFTPGCPNCRAMEPDLQATAADFADEVQLVQIDGAETPDLMAELGVRAAPTLIGVGGGVELFRSTGRRSRAELTDLFTTAQAQRQRGTIQMSRADRALRLLVGLVLVGFGLASGPSWVLVTIGMAILAWVGVDAARSLRSGP